MSNNQNTINLNVEDETKEGSQHGFENLFDSNVITMATGLFKSWCKDHPVAMLVATDSLTTPLNQSYEQERTLTVKRVFKEGSFERKLYYNMPYDSQIEVMRFISNRLDLAGYTQDQIHKLLKVSDDEINPMKHPAKSGAQEWLLNNIKAATESLDSDLWFTQPEALEQYILENVSTAEEQMKNLGVKMTRKQGIQLAKTTFLKYVLLMYFFVSIEPAYAYELVIPTVNDIPDLYTLLWIQLVNLFTHIWIAMQWYYKPMLVVAGFVVGFVYQMVANITVVLVYLYRQQTKSFYESCLAYHGQQNVYQLEVHSTCERVKFTTWILTWGLAILSLLLSFYLQRKVDKYLISKIKNFFKRIQAWRAPHPTERVNKDDLSEALTSMFPQLGRVLENSMPNSGLLKCAKVNGLMAIMTEVEEKGNIVLSHVGLAMRCSNYLVTACHVVERIDKAGGKMFVIPYKNDGKTSTLNKELAVEIDYEDRNSRILSEEDEYNFDVVIIKKTPEFFSKMGVSKLTIRSALHGSMVTTMGPLRSDFMYMANGSVLKNEDLPFGRVSYDASTHPGWSGGAVMSGNRVVAMHQKGDKDHNEGLMMVYVDFFIRRHEKVRGLEDSTDIFWDPVKRIVRNRHGEEVNVKWKDTEYFEVTNERGYVEIHDWEDLREFEPEIAARHQGTYRRNENADFGDDGGSDILISRAVSKINKVKNETVMKHAFRRLKTTQKDVSEEFGTPVKLLKVKLGLSGVPSSKGNDKLVEEIIDVESARKLGFEEGKYAFPSLGETEKDKRETVKNSFVKHIELFKKSHGRTQPPSKENKYKVVEILKEMLRANRYKMVKNPLGRENIENIINSTRIKGNKSPGHPFIENSLTTNASVIEKYKIDGLMDLMAKKTKHNIHVFPKNEPTKRTKLDKGMVRIISGVGLLDQIKAHAYFSNLNVTASENYRKSPIMCGWSPNKPTDGEWFYNQFSKLRNRSIYTDDCKNWDYSFNDWMIQIVATLAIELAIPEVGMSQEEIVEWKRDAYQTAIEQFRLNFQLPDGSVYSREIPCIMTSGSVLTFMFNSMAMLTLDTLAKLEMGYSKRDILEKFMVKVGGDDKIQAGPKDFDHEKYKEKFDQFGVELHDAHKFDTMNGAEFFSVVFSGEPGEAKWTPTRFTKHVASLLNTKMQDLPAALTSHMLNWVHDDDKFNWFRDQFLRGNSRYKQDFKLEDLVDQTEWKYKLKGLECQF